MERNGPLSWRLTTSYKASSSHRTTLKVLNSSSERFVSYRIISSCQFEIKNITAREVTPAMWCSHVVKTHARVFGSIFGSLAISKFRALRKNRATHTTRITSKSSEVYIFKKRIGFLLPNDSTRLILKSKKKFDLRNPYLMICRRSRRCFVLGFFSIVIPQITVDVLT